VAVDATRRHAIERHHTVTHILHWALHEVVSQDATQKGSNVTPDKLTFDFNSAALTAAQLADIEKLVNERIVANDVVSWTEVPYTEAKANTGIMQLLAKNTPRTSASCRSAAKRMRSMVGAWNSAAAPTPATPARSASSASSPKEPSPLACAASKPSPAWKPTTPPKPMPTS
jgi:hypothetical protein